LSVSLNESLEREDN